MPPVEPAAPSIQDGADLLSISAAAREVGVLPRTIRLAIKRKELEAFIIGGRDPLRSGRGLGYRIRREHLQAWYFGSTTPRQP